MSKITSEDVSIEVAVKRFQETEKGEYWLLIQNGYKKEVEIKASKSWIPEYDWEDVVSVCTLALLEAARTWKEEKGRFRTHFWNCANNAVTDHACSRYQQNKKEYEDIWDIRAELIEDENQKIRNEELLLLDLDRFIVSDRQRKIVRGLVKQKLKQEIGTELGLGPAAISWEIRALRENQAVVNYLTA